MEHIIIGVDPHKLSATGMLTKGTHRLVFGATGQMNVDAGDGHPYVGLAEQMVTVTCDKSRRDYK